MAKSAEKGRVVLEGINKLAVESPFRSGELVQEAKQLAAFSFKDDQIIPTLRVLGDVASGTGVDMGRLSLALGQVNVIGRLMGQELRQFTNAGVPLIKYLALAMGEAEDRVPQLVRQGMVGFNDVAKAMNLMTQEGGLFYGMMKRINEETVYGRWQNFVETLEITGRRLALAAMNAFGVREALTDITSSIQGLSDEDAAGFFNSLAGAIKFLWSQAKEGITSLRAMASSLSQVSVPEWMKSLGVGVVSGASIYAPFLAIGAAVGVVTTAFAVLRMTLRLTGVEFLATRAVMVIYHATNVGIVVTTNLLTAALVTLRWTMISIRAVVVLTTAAVLALSGAWTLAKTAVMGYAISSAAWTTLTTTLSSLLSFIGPLGVVAVILGTIAAVLYQIGALDGLFSSLGTSQAKEVFGEIKAGFQSVIDLLRSGEIEEAWKVALKGLEVAWGTTLVYLEAELTRFWRQTQNKFKPQGGDIFSGLNLMGNDFMAWLDRNVPGGKLTDDQINRLRDKYNSEVLKNNLANNMANKKEVDEDIKRAIESGLQGITARRELAEMVQETKVLLGLSKELRDVYRSLAPETVKQGWTGNLFGAINTLNSTVGGTLVNRPQSISQKEIDRIRDDIAEQQRWVIADRARAAKFPEGDGGRQMWTEAAERSQSRIDQMSPVLEDRLRKASEFDRLQKDVIGLHLQVVGKIREYSVAQKAGLVQQAKDLSDSATTLHEKYKEGLKKLEKLSKDIQKETGGISILPKVGADTLKYIQDMEREMIRTGEPFEQFTKHMGMIKEAVEGPNGALAAMGLLGPGAALEVWKPIIDQSEAGELRFREYEKLRAVVDRNRQEKVAPNATIGSTTAQDIVNRNQVLVRGTQEDILETLREANRLSREANTRRERIIEELDKLSSSGSPLVTAPMKQK